MPRLRHISWPLILTLSACGAGNKPSETRARAGATPGGQSESGRAVVANRTAPVPAATDPRERVVFVRAGSVWMMKPDGSDASQLTVRPLHAPDERPAISPSGKEIAYSSPMDGSQRIYRLTTAELIPTPITDGQEGDTEPSWSPDGKRIAFMRGDPRDARALYVVGADGSSPRLLVAGDDDEPELAGGPAWSPDGTSIVFSSDRREGVGTLLWLVEIDSGKLRRLTPIMPRAPFVADIDPAWSPDGKRIVFASNRHVVSADDATDYDLYSVAADGSGLTRLTDDPGVAGDPAFSPDGKRLFFTSTRETVHSYETELYVMAAGGGVQTRLTRDERPQNKAPSAGLAR